MTRISLNPWKFILHSLSFNKFIYMVLLCAFAEITANLAPQTTKNIWQFIFTNYGHKTIIAISHEDELIKHVKRSIIFKNGKMIDE